MGGVGESKISPLKFPPPILISYYLWEVEAQVGDDHVDGQEAFLGPVDHSLQPDRVEDSFPGLGELIHKIIS